MGRLRYANDATPGITRRRRGRGFSYHRPDGRLVRHRPTLERIRALAIPPAWTDVWICPSPDGHVQATGRDARGRKQYRYHDEWRRRRDGVKWEHLAEFGEALTRIREKVQRDLRRDGLPRERVLAAVVRLLDKTLARVGNSEYVRDNNTFGLTTLRNRHAEVNGQALRLCYPAKGGKEVELELEDERLARIVRRCREIPGYELFQYVDDTGERHGIDSGDVNDYLREAGGGDFTAKDFRTWGATVLAVDRLCTGGENDGDRTAQAREAIDDVAEQLANTPGVCRSAYVDPRVIEEHERRGLDWFPPSRAKRFRGLTVPERRLMTVFRRLAGPPRPQRMRSAA